MRKRKSVVSEEVVKPVSKLGRTQESKSVMFKECGDPKLKRLTRKRKSVVSKEANEPVLKVQWTWKRISNNEQ